MAYILNVSPEDSWRGSGAYQSWGLVEVRLLESILEGQIGVLPLLSTAWLPHCLCTGSHSGQITMNLEPTWSPFFSTQCYRESNPCKHSKAAFSSFFSCLPQSEHIFERRNGSFLLESDNRKSPGSTTGLNLLGRLGRYQISTRCEWGSCQHSIASWFSWLQGNTSVKHTPGWDCNEVAGSQCRPCNMTVLDHGQLLPGKNAKC